ncbi:hypothetical protein FACS189476_11010 [Spirochaetia bacterium]|nr:hypothetical protein FACS189476_11010 [Spirochaetia bacterium]
MKTTKKWNKMFLVGMLGMTLNGIVLMGCISLPTQQTPIVYDKEISQQEQSVITPAAYVSVSHFDENKVQWTLTNDVFIPAGSHTLRCNWYNGSSYANGMEITYDFKPGYAYWVDANHLSGGFVKLVIKEIGMLPLKLEPVSNGSEIVIKRKKAIVGGGATGKIIVDGIVMGQVYSGQEIQFVVPNGQHTIYAEGAGWGVSKKLSFDENNQQIVFMVDLSHMNETTLVKEKESELSKGD